MSTQTIDRPVVAAEPRPVRRRRNGVERAKARAGWLLLAPSLVHSILFIALPGVMAVYLSFTNARVAGQGEWIGVKNYLDLFQDADFLHALKNTLLYTVAVVPVAMAVSLAVAIGLNQKIPGRALFRTLFYIPVVTSTVAVAAVWLWIYNPAAGLGNQVLAFFGVARSGWLTDPDVALPALMLVGIWQGLGAKMIIYLAALQSISPDLLEAAKLDGASKWQTFWNVTWPGLAPVHFFVLVTSIASSFQVFDLIYVTTGGGPANATNVLTFDIFSNAFERLHLGYASAETVVMLVFVGILISLGRLSLRGHREDL
ncbi:carbohydrate ABC transporter permease [Kribbella italica]|uniref:Multiple sugar transport system permease protein n=1 Tax=Kribbella italica TaxID=1540520 RepID=A0A7W9J5L6_9ACTN|nr:sugar ABC transporter permease [Kribbella italica]MBB5835527.1 multiple sugar transport system permease protein [Kribbella italica]